MRKTFAPLDDMLIERVFQPASDAISDRIGLGREIAACFCLDLASLAWIVSRVSGLSDAVSAWDACNACLNAALLLLGLVALMSLRLLFRRAGGKAKNPLRMAMQPHRAVVLLMLVVRLTQLGTPSIAGVADVAMWVCAASALYLGACAARPPVRRHWAALVPAAG